MRADAGRILIIAGITLALIGIGLRYWKIPLGRLPGDIHIIRGNMTLYIPLASAALISLIVTLIANVICRMK